MKEITVEKILCVLNTHIENSKFDLDMVDSDLTEFGMDSIAFIRVVVALEEEFECEIPDSKLSISEMNTAKKILKVLCSIDENPMTMI